MAALLEYPFTAEDSQKAYDEWGANCGPNALAFALGWNIADVLRLLIGFDEKRYTNPTMMREALRLAGQPFKNVTVHDPEEAFDDEFKSLCRIQWHGPWMAENVNPRWRYRQTHWVSMFEDSARQLVFDCNGGIRTLEDWEREIVPRITKEIPRADGQWSLTHIWKLSSAR